MRTGLVWLRIGQAESSCELGIEPSGSTKCWKTIECPNKSAQPIELENLGQKGY
jgi:hypothetical protein